MLFTPYDKLPENLNASALRPDCWQCPIHKTYSCWNFSDFNRKKMFLKTCGYASPLTYRRAQRPLWISWVVINWIKSRPPHTLLEYINMNARSLSSCFHFLLCHHFPWFGAMMVNCNPSKHQNYRAVLRKKPGKCGNFPKWGTPPPLCLGMTCLF